MDGDKQVSSLFPPDAGPNARQVILELNHRIGTLERELTETRRLFELTTQAKREQMHPEMGEPR